MAGKVDWMGAGLPVEGSRGPYVGGAIVDVATCRPGEPAAEVAARIDERAAVVTPAGVVVGLVDPERLGKAGEDDTVLDVMEVVPSTLRPSVLLADVDERAAGQLVTTVDGVLLGAVDPAALQPADPDD